MKYLKYLTNYILSFFYDIYYFLFGDVSSRIQGFEYYKKSKKYPGYLKQGNMVVAVKSLALKYCKGDGLDIGSGKWPIEGARGIEDKKDENAFNISEENNSKDFIFSSHVLEHLNEWKKALNEWNRVLKDGGVVFLYLPHESCEMWEPGVNPQHLWSPDVNTVVSFLKNELNMEIIETSILPDAFLSFVVIAKK